MFVFEKCSYDELQRIRQKENLLLSGWGIIEEAYIDETEKIYDEDGTLVALINYYFLDEKKDKMMIALFEVFEQYRRNSNTKSKDYSKTKDLMRPGHADYTGYMKYGGFNDYRGGGHFSGRITAPLVFAGAICKQILEKQGIFILAHVNSIGKVKDKSFLEVNINRNLIESFKGKELPLIDSSLEELMRNEVLEARKDMDSVGGTIECAVLGIKPGIGNPFFDSVESTIAHLMFSVPAVKGIEFGKGFDISKMRGSEANDEYYLDNEEIKTRTNNNGGILGGITNGMPIIFNVAIKPTASIFKEQKTVNIANMKEETLNIEGRHDPCIVQRALPVIEAVTAIGMLELINS